MQKPSDILIERAAKLWARKLLAPVFDNGDSSINGALGMALCEINSSKDKEDINDFASRVTWFEKTLIRQLKYARDNDEYFDTFLSTDYAPGKVLADAAETAGIPNSAFSIKSSVYIGPEYISSSFGYGAPNDYHYPLDDGRWLVCKLSGDDIDLIKKHVMDGNEMGFTVEDPEL